MAPPTRHEPPTAPLSTAPPSTTQLPTTQLPTTQLPTTQLPTTQLPTTQLPTTQLPTTQPCTRQPRPVPAPTPVADGHTNTPPAAAAERRPRLTATACSVALLCLAAALLEAAVDLLPDDAVVAVLTPLRLTLLLGLAALAVAGARPAQLRSPLDPAVVVLLLAAAASTALAGQPWAPWRGLLTAVGVFYLAVGVRRVLPGSWPALALLALISVAVAGTTAARQIATGTATGFCRGALDGSADVCTGTEMIRATGTFANPNLLAAFLVLLLPVAAAGAAAPTDRGSRLIGTAVVVVGYAAVLLTASRGGILAAVAGVAAFVVLRRPTRRRLLVVGAATVVAGGVLAVVSGGRFGVRNDVWAAAVDLLVAEPLGVGPGRAGALLDAAIEGDEAFAHAHNLWLNWAVEAGVPGLLAVLALTALTGAVTVRAARRGSAVAAAAGAGLAGFAVLSLADHPANATRLSLALWVVLALVAAEALPGRRSRQLGRRSVGVPAGARSRSGSR